MPKKSTEPKSTQLFETLPTVAVQQKITDLQRVIQNPNSTQFQVRFTQKLINRLKEQG